MHYNEIIAQNLLQIKAIKLSPQSPFTWASGLRSPIYCDNRISLSHPGVRNKIKKGLAEISTRFPEFDMIAGVATAGIAHGALLADELQLPFCYIRSEAKSHGRQNQIEGEIPKGSKILVIEDLISTGGSSLKVVSLLRNLGFEVVGIAAIFTYSLERARLAFEENNCQLETISNYQDLIVEAQKNDYISPSDSNLLSQWNKDPQAWSDSFNQKH